MGCYLLSIRSLFRERVTWTEMHIHTGRAEASMQDTSLGTSDCKTEPFVHAKLVANSSIDRRAQPQIAVERFAVSEFRRPLPIGRLQSDAPRAL